MARERDNTLEELLPAGSYSWMFPMKTFIDRTVPRYTEIKDKDFYFIMTAADTEKANLFRLWKLSEALPRIALTAQTRQV